MIVIKCNALMKEEQFYKMYDVLVEMAKIGVIFLPECCELLNEVPYDTEVLVVKAKEVKERKNKL